MTNFRLHEMSSESKGRPVHAEMTEAFETVCFWLENENDSEFLTLKELHEKISLSKTGEVYTIKTLKQKLQDKYQDHIYFSEQHGRENIIGFRNMTDRILRELKQKKSQTKEDIIVAAAKLLKADVREMEISTEQYPSIEDIQDQTWIPESLQTLLKMLISSPVKQQSIGQCITQASRPRTLLCPLQVGLSVCRVRKDIWFKMAYQSLVQTWLLYFK